jgi:hypothetical protein
MAVAVLLSLEGLPGMLVPGQVILVSLLFGNVMGMGACVLQFGGTLVVLVMGSAVITSGHIKNVNARRAPTSSGPEESPWHVPGSRQSMVGWQYPVT